MHAHGQCGYVGSEEYRAQQKSYSRKVHHKSMQIPGSYLLAGVFHKELKLLVPHRCTVAPCMAGVIILAAPEGLRAHFNAAVRIGLPGETPDWQIPGLQQGHLRSMLTSDGYPHSSYHGSLPRGCEISLAPRVIL